MITPTEAGITQGEWDDLAAGVENPLLQAVFYQWNPAFAAQSGDTAVIHDFDTVLWDNMLYRVTFDGVTRLNDGNWESVSGYTSADGQVEGAPPAIVGDGSNLYVFALTDTGISLRSYDGESWSAWSEIITDSAVQFIAATAPDTLHFVTYDATYFRYQLKVAIDDSGWSVTASDIHWGYPIYSFGAKRVGGRDALVFIAQVPGIPSVRTVGTELVKYVLPRGGLFVVPYQYGSWGDHREIDLVDEWSAYHYRQDLCISSIDDTLWLTAYSSEGSKESQVTGTRIYSSKDGLHWSRGELLTFPDDLPFGVQILALDSTLYGITRDRVYHAPRTLWFGQSAEETMLDVTDFIDSWSIQRRDIQQITLTLNNEDNLLDETILNGDNTLALAFSTGHDDVLIQTGLFEVDTLEIMREIPDQLIRVTARDRLAWLSSRTQSEQFRNWEPQAIGVDEYVDSSGTGYGGMTHTFPLRGSYKAESGLLKLKSNNAEGIAISTFHHDEWNGADDTHFQLASLGNDEFAGLALRMQDADNGFFYFYNQSDDKLYLIQREAGVDTPLWSSSAKSWSGGLNVHCLRAEFRYCRIRLYSGEPQGGNLGVQWALEQSLLVSGQDGDDFIVQAGYVGTRGKGYSEEDTWNDTPPLSPVPAPFPDYPLYEYPASILAAFHWSVGESREVHFYNDSQSKFTITSYTWSFGDGTPNSNEENPVHTFATDGPYIVTLVIQDAGSQSASVSHEVRPGVVSFWEWEIDLTQSSDTGELRIWHKASDYPGKPPNFATIRTLQIYSDLYVPGQGLVAEGNLPYFEVLFSEDEKVKHPSIGVNWWYSNTGGPLKRVYLQATSYESRLLSHPYFNGVDVYGLLQVHSGYLGTVPVEQEYGMWPFGGAAFEYYGATNPVWGYRVGPPFSPDGGGEGLSTRIDRIQLSNYGHHFFGDP